MDQQTRTAVTVSSLADRMDDALTETRKIRDRLTRLECALVLAGAALRSQHIDPAEAVAMAIEHMRGGLERDSEPGKERKRR